MRGRLGRRPPSGEFDDELHLDRGVEREDGDADGRARVAARVAEDLAEQLGRAVDDARLAGEGGGGDATKTSFTTRVTRSSDPEPGAAAARALSAHSGEATGHRRRDEPWPPTLPVAGQRADTNGSWPDV